MFSCIISKFLVSAVRCGSFTCALRILASMLFVALCAVGAQRRGLSEVPLPAYACTNLNLRYDVHLHCRLNFPGLQLQRQATSPQRLKHSQGSSAQPHMRSVGNAIVFCSLFNATCREAKPKSYGREFRCCAAGVLSGMLYPQLSTERKDATTTQCHSNFHGGAQFATPA